MPKPAAERSMVDLAELTARRRPPSSPRQRRRLRKIQQIGLITALIGASSAICLWLLLA